MFRVKESDSPHGFSVMAGAVLSALMLAFVVDAGCTIIALREYRELRGFASRPAAERPTLASLERTTELLVIVTLGMGSTLIVSLLALAWLFWRFQLDRQSLRLIKTHAYNILASIDQGVVTTDNDGLVVSINSAASHLLGVDFDCVGGALERIESAGLCLTEMSRLVLSGDGPVRDRAFRVQRNGCRQQLLADAHPLKDADGKQLGCVIHLRDVTQRVLIEERMSRMERYMSLGALAAGLHHEIKNPLTALSIHVQLLEERLRDPGATEPVDQLLSVLNTEVHRLNGVLESFRSFTSLQKLTLKEADLVNLLEDVVRLVRPHAERQNVEVILSPPAGELPRLTVDAEKLEQAVLNLAINALEAMPAGGTLSIGAAERHGEVHLEIADTGAGIPGEIQRNLFKPYFSTKDKGTGMGLVVTEKIVSQHGGHVDFQTGRRGTTFRLSLPLRPRGETP